MLKTTKEMFMVAILVPMILPRKVAMMPNLWATARQFSALPSSPRPRSIPYFQSTQWDLPLDLPRAHPYSARPWRGGRVPSGQLATAASAIKVISACIHIQTALLLGSSSGFQFRYPGCSLRFCRRMLSFLVS